MKNNFYKRVICLIAIVTMVGCGSGKPGEDKNNVKKILNLNFASEPSSIDPVLISSIYEGSIVYHMYEGLMKWDNPTKNASGMTEAKAVLGQARDYNKTVNEDGSVDYEFTLRDDLKWSDGKSITAKDFVAGWQHALDPKSGCRVPYIYDMVKNAQNLINGTVPKEELGVKALDDRRFIISLDYDCPYFIKLCTLLYTSPVREDIISKYGDEWTFNPKSYICNGPFKLEKWEHNSYILLSRNEYYYNKKDIKLNGIKFVLTDDVNAGLASYRNNELDYIQKFPVDEIPQLKKSKEFFILPYKGIQHVCFQTQNPPFDNVNVRRAFSLAIDRNYIIEHVTQTNELPAGAFVPPGFIGANGDDFRETGGNYYSIDQKSYKENCEIARRLLEEAGYPNGDGFPVVEYIYNRNDINRAMAENLQNMWQNELGIKVTLSSQDLNVFLATLLEGDYGFGRLGLMATYDDPIVLLETFRSDNKSNRTRYSNHKFDELLRRSKLTFDSEEHFNLLHQAERILIDDMAIAPIHFYTNPCMLKSNIRGGSYTPLAYVFFMYADKK